MPKFEVYVKASGKATITAPTKKEADAKARRGEFDPGSISHGRWTAEISSLKKVSE